MDGHDMPDFTADEGARLPSANAIAREIDALDGDKPFIMHPDGWAGCSCPAD